MAIWSAEIKELEALYKSVSGQFPELDKELEELIKAENENVALLYSRRCLEVIVTDLCEIELNRPRKTEPLKGIIDKLNKEEKVPSHIITSMYNLNSLSSYGTHPKEYDPQQVRPVLLNLATILEWYYKQRNIVIEKAATGKIERPNNITEQDKGLTNGTKLTRTGIIENMDNKATSNNIGKDIKVSILSRFTTVLRKTHIVIPGVILLIAVCSLIIWRLNHKSMVLWARQEAIPEIEQLTKDMPWHGEGPNTWIAFELAMEASQYIPNDPVLTRLWPLFSHQVKFYSDPPGARVFAKPYSDIDGDWRYQGQTPIDSIRFPLGFSRLKIEKEDYRTIYDVTVWNKDSFSYQLSVTGDLPENMEMLPAAYTILHLPGLEDTEGVELGDFLMDRYEVTNEEYKRFVDTGGYQDPKYWIYPFVKDDRTLGWEEAIRYFTDKTGRPGPATWEVGDYPDGENDYPVSGLSWYEAAAYAEFAGKNLPTIYHWDHTAVTYNSADIVPLSNINSDGPIPVGSSQSMNRFGIYDLSGNVREWCFNESGRSGERFILGGGWNDPDYSFNDAFAQPPFDRSEINGFRCIKYLGSERDQPNLKKIIMVPYRDFLNEQKVSDETFALFLNQYSYDKTELNAVVESIKEGEDYIREKITFDAAYGNERMMAYLFLPKHGTPPYQTIINFPGAGAIYTRSSESLNPEIFLLKSGRAFLYPIYKGTFEREDDLNSDYPNETNFYKEHVIMWAKDLSRSIDYLETRDYINTDKLAYYGGSWGGAMGAIMPAVERRIKTSVLVVAGLYFQRSLPEVDQIHFLSRLETPVLMLNGKYDYFFPYETSQLPFFQLLGTPEENKRIFVYEGGHAVPSTQLIKETLAWLDRYLGPVN